MAALLAQPALSQTYDAPALSASAVFDPLLVDRTLYLGPRGELGDEPAGEGTVPAPMALPPGESTAAWAWDAGKGGTLVGSATLLLQVRADLPGAALPPRALFSVRLVKGGEPLAEADAGPQVLLPGVMNLQVPLDLDGKALASGDGVGLEVSYRSINPGPAPAIHYIVGAQASRLSLTLRLPSLDALGHHHAPGDQHFLARDYRFRGGDLGNGLWGTDLSIGKSVGGRGSFYLPDNVSRVLLQMYFNPEDDSDPSAPQRMVLDLPGGLTTLYRGEVLVREMPLKVGDELRCQGCAPGGQSAMLARAQPLPGSAPPPQEPLTPTGGPAGPSAPYAAGADEGTLWLLALFMPAALMLGGSIVYVMRTEGPWGLAPAPRRAPARVQPRAPARAVRRP